MGLFLFLVLGGVIALIIGRNFDSTFFTTAGVVMLAFVIILLLIAFLEDRRKRRAEEQKQKALEAQKREAEKKQRCENQVQEKPATAKRAEVSNLLESLPKAKIEVDFNVAAPREPDCGNISFSRITSRSSLPALGRFVAIDVETTGLSPAQNDIVEIAAIRFEDYKPVSVFHTLCKPPRGIQSKARAINGITDQMVADKPTFTQIAESLRNYIGQYPLVGHNLAFDLRFIHSAGGFLPAGKKFDTLSLVRAAHLDDLPSKRLTDVCDYFDIFIPQAHSSVSDAYASAMVYIKLISYARDVSETS